MIKTITTVNITGMLWKPHKISNISHILLHIIFNNFIYTIQKVNLGDIFISQMANRCWRDWNNSEIGLWHPSPHWYPVCHFRTSLKNNSMFLVIIQKAETVNKQNIKTLSNKKLLCFKRHCPKKKGKNETSKIKFWKSCVWYRTCK